MENIGRFSAAIYRLTQSLFNNKLKELDISSGQYDFLLVISREEGISQKELCDLLYVEKSTTAKAVKNLISKGYIYNKQIGNDRRYSSLYMTDRGMKAAAAVEAVFTDIMTVSSRGILEPEIDAAVGLMKKVIDNLQDEKVYSRTGGL